ncbi:MAG: hypothetical protein D6760_13105, partial [Deltaproteobacteria bacterium]
MEKKIWFRGWPRSTGGEEIVMGRTLRRGGRSLRASSNILLLAAGCMAFLVSARPAAAWWYRTQGTDSSSLFRNEARALAEDPAGDIVAAGSVGNVADAGDFVVVKLVRVTGSELWRWERSGTAPGLDTAYSVAIDGSGDVLAAGTFENSATNADFAVVKLDGATGTELWRREIDGSANTDEEAAAVVVDASGDVVVAGTLSSPATQDDFAVVKLDGTTGAELWRVLLDGSAAAGNDAAYDVALDAGGNVFAVGRLKQSSSDADFAVVKLAGETGAELWRREIDGLADSGSDGALRVAVDPAGDVIAAGNLYSPSSLDDLAVIKFAGATGGELWRYVSYEPNENPGETATALAIDAGGHVVVGAFLPPVIGVDPWEYSSESTSEVVKIDGGSGAMLWRQYLGERYSFEPVPDVAV